MSAVPSSEIKGRLRSVGTVPGKSRKDHLGEVSRGFLGTVPLRVTVP